MPGSHFYILSQVIEYLENWWSFGNLSQFTYHLSLADKKLIEAKTLFEYKQYLLASNAIPKYEDHLTRAKTALEKAKKEGKDISQKKALFIAAIAKHKEVLEKIDIDTPPVFIWQPERVNPIPIKIHNLLLKAIELGKTYSKE